jgi:hypothetical protein
MCVCKAVFFVNISSKRNVFKMLTALNGKLCVLLSVEPSITLLMLFKTWDNKYKHLCTKHHHELTQN